jgi:hypothetical protein
MRDDVLEVLKRDASKAHRDAAFAVAGLIEDDEIALRALPGRSLRGDCIALLTPRRLLVGGGGLDRAYDLSDLATVVVLSTSGGRALFPASNRDAGDMFYVNAEGEEFARAVREELARIRPSDGSAPIWERSDFTDVVRLEDAGLLAAPRESQVVAGSVVIVMISGAGIQIRHADGSAGTLIRWRDVLEARVEGVDQAQMRPRVGAVVAFGVLGLAARRKEKRAYLTLQTRDGDYLVEDGSHLPLELRALLAPFGIGERSTHEPTGWQYKQLRGADADESLWHELDDLGSEGGELVNAATTTGGLLLILKRPIIRDRTPSGATATADTTGRT